MTWVVGQVGSELANDHLLFLVSLAALLVIFFCVWLLFRDYFQWRRNMEIMLRRSRQPLLIVVIVRKVFGRRAKVEKVIAGQFDEDFTSAALRRQIAGTPAEPAESEEAESGRAAETGTRNPSPPPRDPGLL